MSGRRLAAVVTAAITAVLALCLVAAAATGDDVDRTVVDDRVTESSGLAASTQHAGVLYTHNDSDDGPRVFAIDAAGRTVAVLTLDGAPARDWEGMSPGVRGSDTFWIGDIGDNIDGWGTYRAYRFDEPAKLTDRSVPWKQYDLRYDDGESHNAESLMVHPVSGRLYVVTKEVMGAGLYATSGKPTASGTNTLKRVARSLPYATDAAFSPDGSLFVVRGYVDAKVYRTDEPAKSIATIDLPGQPQGESIAWSPDGQSLYAGSEGRNSKVYRVGLPESVRAELSATTAASSSTSTAGAPSATASAEAPGQVGPTGGDIPGDDADGIPREQLVWLALAAIVLIALGFSMRQWAKHSHDD